jgi:hypothetical protein
MWLAISSSHLLESRKRVWGNVYKQSECGEFVREFNVTMYTGIQLWGLFVEIKPLISHEEKLLWISTSAYSYMSSETEGAIRCLYRFGLGDYSDSFYMYSVQLPYSTVRHITYASWTHRSAVTE